MYTITKRFYTENCDVFAWISNTRFETLEGVREALVLAFDFNYKLCVLNENHPHYLQMFDMNLLPTNIMVRDPSGKLIKWKHLL